MASIKVTSVAGTDEIVTVEVEQPGGEKVELVSGGPQAERTFDAGPVVARISGVKRVSFDPVQSATVVEDVEEPKEDASQSDAGFPGGSGAAEGGAGLD